MACDSRLLDLDSRNRALQTIATNVEEALHVKHQVVDGWRSSTVPKLTDLYQK
ncbi:unnamed protein product [Enterobius vermicularis]|uniref:WXG100 family type VII secretion target n=1 Tax=Enterobius vermicularis TaxID=51028 RepID=A0A0N4VRP3_ENTVE|nr:unnamed protein product [Enterobius vermicularis]